MGLVKVGVYDTNDHNFTFRANIEPLRVEKKLSLSLSEEDRFKIRQNLKTVTGKKGRVIFQENEEANYVYYIRSGIVKLSIDTPTGESVTLQLLTEGSIFGHLCLISNTSLYTATSLTPCEFYVIPRNVFRDMVEESFTLSTAVSKIIFDEIKTLRERIISLYSRSIIQRLAEALVNMDSIFGKDEEGYISIRITKSELSNIVGASIESVFRALASLKDLQLIEQNDKRLRILNEVKLKRLYV